MDETLCVIFEMCDLRLEVLYFSGSTFSIANSQGITVEIFSSRACPAQDQ